MATDNSITTINGRLTKDAELRFTQNGTAVMNFDIANNRSFKKNEEWKTDVLFMTCEVWGKYAESLIEKMKKGIFIGVVGRLRQENWEDQNGNKRTTYKLTVQNVQILQKNDNSNDNSNDNQSPPDNNNSENPFSDDDIPF